VENETIRGIEELSCTSRLFGETLDSFEKHSPSYMLRNSVRRTLANHLPPAWLLVHGHRDPIVPFSSSLDFYNELERNGIENLVLDSYEEADHSICLYDLFLNNQRPNGIVHKIREFQNRINEVQKYKYWLDIEADTEFKEFQERTGVGHVPRAREEIFNKHYGM
jgi:hypothetical protein